MKRFVQLFSFIAIAFVFTAVSAQAQSETRVEAEIPFDFTIGETNFSAGTYELRVLPGSSGAARVLFNDKEGNTVHTAMLLRNGSPVGSEAKLVFDVNGDARSLSSITTGAAGYALPRSKKAKSISVRASVPLRKAPERN